MKSFKFYKDDPKPMTAGRFWASIGFCWISSFFGIIVFGPIALAPIAFLTVAGIVMILWRLIHGKPAFPPTNKQNTEDK